MVHHRYAALPQMQQILPEDSLLKLRPVYGDAMQCGPPGFTDL